MLDFSGQMIECVLPVCKDVIHRRALKSTVISAPHQARFYVGSDHFLIGGLSKIA